MSLKAEMFCSEFCCRAQPPGGRCSDWVPTSPQATPHHAASSQNTSSRDQMTSQLTNQINQMSLVNQTVGQRNSRINPANQNPRQVYLLNLFKMLVCLNLTKDAQKSVI